MTPFNRIEGIVAPLPTPNIDTEVMVPIRRLMEFGKGELGPYLFEPLRYRADGSATDFVLNRAGFNNATILVAGENFGCGSSREAAVWALADFGIRCILAPSFGDIFAANCAQNGLLTVMLEAAEIDDILQECSASIPQTMRVDLETCLIQTPFGRIISFDIEPERQRALLLGLDEIGMTLELLPIIRSFNGRQRNLMPWVDLQDLKRRPRVLLMAGDGIGPEVMAEVRRVLDWFTANRKLEVDVLDELYGMSAYRTYGAVLRPEAWDLIDQADAILFGASGSPLYDDVPSEHWLPDRLLQIRQRLDLFDNHRPIRTFEGLADMSSLRPEVISGTDMVIVRELTGGVYFSEPRGVEMMADGRERTLNTMAYDRAQVARIARTAFALARSRAGRLCSVDKANVLEVSMMWREVVIAVHAAEFPDVELSHLYVDNAAMQLVRDPRQFDVIVTENLFGDILSDCAAMIAGSIGMLPSASIGPVDSRGRRQALFEPIHGSAPDIAGRGIANPCGAILSFAMCLDLTLGLKDDAALLVQAVEDAIAAGARTADIAAGGPAIGTSDMGDAVLLALRSRSETVQRPETSSASASIN